MSYDDEVESFESSGCTITLRYDIDPMDPRSDMDRLGTIYYLKESRYTLGDERIGRDDFKDAMDELKVEPGSFTFSMYAYIHSGVALSLSSFSDPWDSGMAGFIHITKEEAKSWFQKEPTEDEVREALKHDLEVWQSYLNGECYGYVISHTGIDLASCWGYYDIGSARADAIQEAERVAPKEPVARITLSIGGETYGWANIGDEAKEVFHNNRPVGQRDTLSGAWLLIQSTQATQATSST